SLRVAEKPTVELPIAFVRNEDSVAVLARECADLPVWEPLHRLTATARPLIVMIGIFGLMHGWRFYIKHWSPEDPEDEFIERGYAPRTQCARETIRVRPVV